MTAMPAAPLALIAEDEPLLAAHLRAELATLWPALRIAPPVGDGLSATAQALALPADICFFDVRMPGTSGLEAAQALAEDWPPRDAPAAPFPLIVFVTAYDQYALQAFAAQAVDYLVKPVDHARLAGCVARLQAQWNERVVARSASRHTSDAAAVLAAAALQRAVQQLGALTLPAVPAAATPPRLQVIQAQVGAVVHLVPVDDVIYFEAADKYVRVLTAEREHLIRLSLKELLPQLDPDRFWQVHRGTVVQARCIAQARRDESGKVLLTLRGRPETVVASRLYAQRFKGM